MPSLSTAKTNLGEDSGITEEKVGLWKYILMTSTNVNPNDVVEENWTIVVLGDTGSGKTTLVSRLKGVEPTNLDVALALDYTYFELIDREDESHLLGLVDVWQLSGIEEHVPLLKIGNDAEALNDTIFVICVDLCEPWKMMESLNKWVEVIKTHLSELDYEDGREQELTELTERFFREYKDPEGMENEEEEEEADQRRHRRRPLQGEEDEDETPEEKENEDEADPEPKPDGDGDGDGEGDDMEPELPPLPEGALEENLGVTIIVVATKADAFPNLSKKNAYKDAHFDYIQESLRRWCLKYGAGLCYTSAKDDVNIDTLWDYLKHILYFKFPLENGPEVMEKDRIFIPIGWDSLGKIGALSDSSAPLIRKASSALDEGDITYEDVIKPPFHLPSTDAADAVVTAMDDQQFLAQFKDSIAPAERGGLELLSTKNTTKKAQINDILSKKPGSARGKASKPGTPAGGKTGDIKQINQFFSNLLTKGATTEANRTETEQAFARMS